MNSQHAVTRRIAIAVSGAGAALGFIFVALFLGGSPRLFDTEWLGLVSLIAGLAGAVLWGHSRGLISRPQLFAVLSCLALWTAAAAMTH